METEFHPTATTAHILCCQCGTAIVPNSANMCMPCIQGTVDITEGIPRQLALSSCRGCQRWLQPPMQWLPAELESKELMALILRRLKQLSKVRLVDAVFVWTEPHSKRVKVKLTIQKEAFVNTILQSTFVVECVVGNQQCGDCAKVQAKNTWNSVVQVRQKVDHKRTFLFLEQVILKNEAHRECCNVKVVKDGIDFYFDTKTPAVKFCDFLHCVVPCRDKHSEQLISQDLQSGSSTYKFTFSVEIVPVCREDLVLLPNSLCRSLGGVSPLLVCLRVATSLHFVDPNTLQQVEMQASSYWKSPFEPLCTHRNLVEFIVLDVEDSCVYDSKMDDQETTQTMTTTFKRKTLALANMIVARVDDFGRSSQTFSVRTHLGHLLKPGDVALGYDLTTANFNSTDLEALLAEGRHELPDVVLVRKSYAHRPKRRPWHLKELPKQMDLDNETPTKEANKAQEKEAVDYERFLQELEENPELRSQVNIYASFAEKPTPEDDGDDANMHTDNDDAPRVSLEELLQDMSIN